MPRVLQPLSSQLLALLVNLTVKLTMLLTVALVVVFGSFSSVVAQDTVLSIRLAHGAEHTRIVFDSSATLKYKTGELNDPHRFFVDLKNITNSAKFPLIKPNTRIAQLSARQLDKDYYRFTIPTKRPLVLKAFQLGANATSSDRLVIDLFDDDKTVKPAISQPPLAEKEQVKLAESITAAPTTVVSAKSEKPAKKVSIQLKRTKKTIIAIDAGHGGADPGAIGARKTKEKHITLSISKKLANFINKNPKFKAVLVRNSDTYIRLRSRTNKARKAQADLFVSIHADAALNRKARGMSVFALSQRGATSELARAIAKKQNQSDLIGGVSIKDKDDDLAQVLLDLSMTNKIAESVDLGKSILKRLSPLGKLHSKRVGQAGFAVLKTPDIPSVLVETGFISNEYEESLLRTKKHQQKLAQAIYKGLLDYVRNNPSQFNYTTTHQLTESEFVGLKEPEKRTSLVSYKVKSGDSLSVLAKKHGTTMSAIKTENNLSRNTLYIGQRLKIPTDKISSSNQSSSKKSITTTNSKPTKHRVRSGESLSSISAKYNVTINSLKRLNRLKGNTVYKGQVLIIRSSGTTSKAIKRKTFTHKVSRGQTLSGLAVRYGVKQSDIIAWNKLKKHELFIGQRLTIKQ